MTFRVGREEIRQEGFEREGPEAHRRGDPHNAVRLRAAARDLLFGLVQLAEKRLAALVNRIAPPREHQPARGSFDEADAEPSSCRAISLEMVEGVISISRAASESSRPPPRGRTPTFSPARLSMARPRS